MSKYVIGIDFGTLSARALVAEVGTGRELGSASMDYPHGVLDKRLPDGTILPPDWALQHPQDYLDCLFTIVPAAVRKAGVRKEDVVGMGLDFTACTLVPTDGQGTPLCLKPAFSGKPHAWPTLWKHHAAQDEANRMTAIAAARGERFLERYGGRVNCEWLFPKLWQVLNEAPEVFAAAARFVEAGDWVVWQLTAREARSSSMAGYKAFWHKRDGVPSPEFFAACDPRLKNAATEKLAQDILPIGSRAGGLTETAAARLGLCPGTAVAVSNIDAHVSLPPAGITEPGTLMMIMGTSTCHILLSREERPVPGMCGAVEDGVVPGLVGYECSQMMGDHYNWFVENCVPEPLTREAAARGIDLHMLLSEKAAALRPGESGLVALDWWNGSRSVLVDGQLSGLMLGMTLNTPPEALYRALVEATAYGARMILDTFLGAGLDVGRICTCGGIARKNPFVMQLYADVLDRELCVARSAETPALGSAMFAAVAAGCYADIGAAAREMGGLTDAVYRPDPENAAVYARLYQEYARLHEYFGRGANDVMKRLKAIQLEQLKRAGKLER